MIEASDNQSADDVWGLLHNPAAQVQAVASDAGMTGFELNDTADSVYVLGQSMITARDFALFFSKIGQMFPATQRSYGLNLLSHLDASDQVGLLQSGLPGTVYSKEGWKGEPTITGDQPYVVNQAAQFQLDGTDLRRRGHRRPVRRQPVVQRGDYPADRCRAHPLRRSTVSGTETARVNESESLDSRAHWMQLGGAV